MRNPSRNIDEYQTGELLSYSYVHILMDFAALAVPRFRQVGFCGRASCSDIWGRSIRMGICIVDTFEANSQSPQSGKAGIRPPNRLVGIQVYNNLDTYAW